MSDVAAAVEGGTEPRVACVLVTWNNREDTERCLRSLAKQVYPKLQVIVVDNGSTDGLVDRLREAYPAVLLIENGSNLGFARACNIGAHRGIAGGADHVWFLNNDTETPPETLGRLVKRAEGDPGLGIVGAVLFYLRHRSRVQAWGGGSIDLWSGFNRHFIEPHAFNRDTYITFASALVRRDAFLETGGLWEELFLYFEDADFSLRAVAAGWRLGVAEDAVIFHAEGGSSDGRRRRSPLMERIQTASGMRFLERHGRVPGIPIAIFLVLRVGNRLRKGNWAALPGVLGGVADWWRKRVTPFREGA